MIYSDFIEAGYRIFGLHAIRDGRCGCGDPECNAAGKHPIASNWQHTPLWSDEQIEVLEMSGQLETGYGVLVSGLLVVDVDARNGGVASYQRLVELIPEIAGAGLIVATGSGGGSKHLYFRLPDGLALMQHHADYSGIDFKSTGFVVGPGSLHASGNRYDVLIGSVDDIAPAPDSLLNLLRKPDRHRSMVSGTAVDITDSDIAAMLEVMDPDCDHETWYRSGMAIHEATGGTGFALWNDWSSRGAKYPGHDALERRWHSFGKSANPVTIGTLMHYAEQAGWRMPVEFTDDTDWLPVAQDQLDTKSVDLLRPPGLVGEIAQWINTQSIYPREHLAVAAALMVVSNVAGMRYHDPLDNTSFNLFCFGVADSSTGKEAILQAHNELLRACGIAAAVHGGIKSEQEVYRNLVRHQAAYYAVDEMGEVLGKINTARTKGTASYLEGVIGTLMSLYSKSNSFAAITGDLKEEVKNSLNTERQRAQKQIDENDDKSGRSAKRLQRLEKALATIDMGLENPFLSIFGLTTPEKFDALMTFDMAVNGFMGRALIFREPNRNPRIKSRKQRTRPCVPDRIRFALTNLYSPGEFDMMSDNRVERVGDKSPVQTSRDAETMLDQIAERFWQMAEEHRDATGLHPIPRRGYELVAKVSAVLAIPSGLRTGEHVTWAYALVLRDIDAKMRLAHSNTAEGTQEALGSRILSFLGSSDGETMRAIKRACRKYKAEDVETAVSKMVDAGVICGGTRPASGKGGTPTSFYYCKDPS
jgi:hypothetical protein